MRNKKYYYILRTIDAKTTFFECKAANIAQKFLDEDIARLIKDLPELILAEKRYKKKQGNIIRFRISVEDKKLIEKKAQTHGYASVSGFLRALALKA